MAEIVEQPVNDAPIKMAVMLATHRATPWSVR
jgi:hypothetical protein